MICRVRSFTLDGISARPVRIEVDVHRGLPGFAILGLPAAAAREACERVRLAIQNSGFEFPLRRIVVNLAPALGKAEPGIDLAIAVALLGASGQVDATPLLDMAIAGALALDGTVRPAPGAVPVAMAAAAERLRGLLLAAPDGPAAALCEELRVVPLHHLAQVGHFASGWMPRPPVPLELQTTPPSGAPDLADLRGQPHLRHALEVAAAGGHSLLMVGPPGAGKSLAASRLPSILPPPGDAEALEVARIASATGRLDAGPPGGRPFRAPHHTISAAGLIGGGTPPRPGEITLAHRGVLFLDELCEFRRDALEALRAPLATGEVTIRRGGTRLTLPCRFMLVLAASLCPCGRGEDDPGCTCPPYAAPRHRNGILAALADRIDLLAAVSPPSAAEIGGAPGESSAAVRERVRAARERQEARLGAGRCNAEMTPAQARECPLRRDGHEALTDLSEDGLLNDVAEVRLLRVVRTLTDLVGSDAASAEQIAVASELCGVAAGGRRPFAPADTASPDPGTRARASRPTRCPRSADQEEKGTP